MVGRRHGDAEADAARHARHARDHRHHVVARPLGAVAHGGVMIAAVILRRAAGIAEEQQVHDAARGGAGDVLVEFRARVVGVPFPRSRHLPQIVGVVVRQVGGKMNEVRFRHNGRLAALSRDRRLHQKHAKSTALLQSYWPCLGAPSVSQFRMRSIVDRRCPLLAETNGANLPCRLVFGAARASSGLRRFGFGRRLSTAAKSSPCSSAMGRAAALT